MHAPSVEHLDSPVFDHHHEAHSSGVSWSAVIGGAFVAAALSLIMLALGAGFGLSAVSPWSNVGASAATAGAAAIIWLIITEAIASAMGGYLAGRLRTRWPAIHNDEVHFRDTANGFIVWAVAVVMTVAFLAAAASTMVGGLSNSGEAAMGAGGSSQASVAGDAYFIDRLFRSEHVAATDNDFSVRAEAAQIFAHALLRNELSAADTAYLAQLVAAKTGLNPNDAERRVADTLAEARQTTDDARKATAHLLLWIFLALLIGAFCASYAATIGGRQRDQVQLI
jgi:flagellar basal body-associated protein FliL